MPELMTSTEVAKVLRVDTTTVRYWIARGTLEAIRLPHANKRTGYRIRREVVERILNGGETRSIA